MNLPPVILASASPRRVELLRQAVFRFKVLPSAAAESEHEQFTPREIALLNAYRKARTVAKRFPDSLVIGADTVVAEPCPHAAEQPTVTVAPAVHEPS